MKTAVLTGTLILLAGLAGQEAVGQQREQIVGSQTELPFSALTSSGHWELRIYTINRGRLDDFVAAWRKGPYVIRTKRGFQIPAAWIDRQNNQFIWIVGYDGPESWEDMQSAYYNSPERTSVDVDPIEMIAKGDTWQLSAVR